MKWKTSRLWRLLQHKAKGGGQTTIHQMYEKKATEENKVFSQFFLSFLLHSLIYSTMFFHPSIQPADKIKKRRTNERTHKTPIHKIKPIPSLSWANCLLEVCWRSSADMEVVYASCPAGSRRRLTPRHHNVLFLWRNCFLQNTITQQMDIYIILGKHSSQ